MGLCREADDFIAEKVHWIATLSDGSKVYQDDHRPGEAQPIAWLRLSEYIKDGGAEGPGIDALHIRFWDHIEEVAPNGAAAYYFINGIMSFPGTQNNHYYYVIGHVEYEKLCITKWLIPSIILFEKEERQIPINDPLLIKGRSPWQKNEQTKAPTNPDSEPVG
jgi:hypothetical protein